jgi:hypothetical protein
LDVERLREGNGDRQAAGAAFGRGVARVLLSTCLQLGGLWGLMLFSSCGALFRH